MKREEKERREEEEEKKKKGERERGGDGRKGKPEDVGGEEFLGLAAKVDRGDWRQIYPGSSVIVLTICFSLYLTVLF